MCRLYLLVFIAFSMLAPAAEKPVFRSSDTLDKLVRETAAAAVDRFGAGGLTAGKIAITVIDLADRDHPARASIPRASSSCSTLRPPITSSKPAP
jgi:hypothetical protein